MELILQAFIAAITDAIAVTLTEIPSGRRWGLQGVFKWHETQSLASFLMGSSQINFSAILTHHFLNGIFASIAFPSLVSFLYPFTPKSHSVFCMGLNCGF